MKNNSESKIMNFVRTDFYDIILGTVVIYFLSMERTGIADTVVSLLWFGGGGFQPNPNSHNQRT